MSESTDASDELREPPVRKIAIKRTAEDLESVAATEHSDHAQLSRSLERLKERMESGDDVRPDDVNEVAYYVARICDRLVDVQYLYGHDNPEVLDQLE